MMVASVLGAGLVHESTLPGIGNVAEVGCVWGGGLSGIPATYDQPGAQPVGNENESERVTGFSRRIISAPCANWHAGVRGAG